VRRDLLVLIAVLVIVTAAAEAFGATNFGTALTFGQIAFAGALLWILLKRP
jgi:hypothetical protein